VSATQPRRALAPRPAAGRVGSRGLRCRAVVPLVIAAAVLGAGCAEDAPGPPAATSSPAAAPTPTSGAADGPALLLLDRADDTAALSLLALSGGIVALPLPSPSTAAIVVLPDGGLVAFLADGRTFLTPGVSELLAGAAWRPLDLGGAAALPPGTIIFGAIASPDGTRLAAIARSPLAEAPSALVLVELDRGRRTIHPLPDESTGAPPAWVDDDRVAIVQRDRFGRTFLAIVVVASGEIVDRISLRALNLGTSGDARTAVILGDESRLLIGTTAAVLERRAAPDDGPAAPASDRARGGLALDREGGRLAVVVEGDDGSWRVAVYERVGDGWRTAIRLVTPPGAQGGAVAWLP